MNKQIKHIDSNTIDPSLLPAESPSMIITSKQSFQQLPYIPSHKTLFIPNQISRFHSIISNPDCPANECLDLISIINWHHTTASFCISELNEQLLRRYNQISISFNTSDTHEYIPILDSLLAATFNKNTVIECDINTFYLLTQSTSLVSNNTAIIFITSSRLHKPF